MQDGPNSSLAFGIEFQDLYHRVGLLKLDSAFSQDAPWSQPPRSTQGLHPHVSIAPTFLQNSVPSSLSRWRPTLKISSLVCSASNPSSASSRPVTPPSGRFTPSSVASSSANSPARPWDEALQINPISVISELEAYLHEPLTEESYAQARRHLARVGSRSQHPARPRRQLRRLGRAHARGQEKTPRGHPFPPASQARHATPGPDPGASDQWDGPVLAEPRPTGGTAKVFTLRTPVPTSSAPLIKPITASSATTKGKTAAPKACTKKPALSKPASSRSRSPAARSKKKSRR